MKTRTIHSILSILLTGLLVGCGLFSPPAVDEDGFYSKHYNACGPTSLSAAFNWHGIRSDGRAQISRKIQSHFSFRRDILTLFSPDAASITWPSEMISVAKEYGARLVEVDKESMMTDYISTYIVLVHRKWTFSYHWFAATALTPLDYFGEDTVIDKIYLLQDIQ